MNPSSAMTPNTLLQDGGAHIRLLGAPDEDFGNPKPKVKTGQAFQIELARETVRDMQRHKQTGKSPLQLSLGKTPVLRFGNTSIVLHATPITFRSELYDKEVKSRQDLHFKAVITHKIALKRAEEVTAASDDALARLQATMASLQKEKEENRATFIDEVKDPKKIINGGRRAAVFLKKPGLFQSVPRSLPSSPALNASHASSSSLAPTSQPAASQPQAFRHTLLHFLAIRPATEQVVLKTTKIPKDKCLEQLQKFAVQQTSSKEWKLNDRWYKELDVWKFPYASQDDRQQAIDNAVRAFDRLRLSREDRLWQLLLPKEDRGKGKILSKLNLHSGAVGIPSSSSKPEVNTEHGPDTPKPFNHRALLAGAGGEPMARTKSLESMSWKGKAGETDPRAKRLLSGKPSKPIPPKSRTKKDDEKKPTADEVKSAAHMNSTKKRRSSQEEKSAQFVEEDEDSGLEEMLAIAPSDSTNAKSREKNLVGRVKTPASSRVAGQKRKAEGKFKSAEIVHDSDEEDDENDQKTTETEVKRVKNDAVAKPVASKASVKDTVSPATKPQTKEVVAKTHAKTLSNQSNVLDKSDVDQAKSAPKQLLRESKTTLGTPKSVVTDGVKASDAGIIRNTDGLPKTKELDKKAASTATLTGKQPTTNRIGAPKATGIASPIRNGKREVVPAKQQSKQLPASKPANALKRAANATAEEQTTGQSAAETQLHKRAESTTNSSINSWVSSISAKSTPMRRQSSSQSSTTSIPTSTMPNSKKRPADFSNNRTLPSSKKRKMGTPLHKPSPPLSSSPLTNASDLQSISSPSVGPLSEHATPTYEAGSDTRQRPEVPQPGPGCTPQSQHEGDLEVGGEVVKKKTQGEDKTIMDGVEVDAATRAVILERLKGQHRTMFASWIKLRIKLDKIKPNIPENMKQESWAACERLEDLKKDIARLGFATGEYEHSSGVPKGFKLDQESEDYLKDRVSILTKEYNKLRDELEVMESRPKDKVEEAKAMYGEARGLRMILHPEA